MRRVVDVLQRGIDDGTHIGAQLYVAQRGDVCADVDLGIASADDPGRPKPYPVAGV
jgi:hypothetical protein